MLQNPSFDNYTDDSALCFPLFSINPMGSHIETEHNVQKRKYLEQSLENVSTV